MEDPLSSFSLPKVFHESLIDHMNPSINIHTLSSSPNTNNDSTSQPIAQPTNNSTSPTQQSEQHISETSNNPTIRRST